ncbi:hypothetical protein HMPREF0645_0812 [Hallella bergensis DSM 17361]|uniref:DUF4296 domain-containing protein n=1 Tax=Hallella bergensis DSM 17361 TaxID=585502 RepID=D1PV27_9BACT|nr:DUF4296 domain-containing protein [Hallella bergensis]EFA44747.1 hypothetical protein HMPREF0645_0812 [Hallella bergensis DSM 17361]
MKHRSITLFIGIAVGLFVFLAGCRPTVPSDIIQEKDMEDILYDYHLSEAMARQNYDQYESNVLTYRTAVFKKHGITQAQFDTSMVYYMRHTERLHAIYKRIAERMEDKARSYGSSEGMLAGLARFSASGDTADIWKGDRTIALVPNRPYNLYSFSYTPDSTFHKGDSFILTLHSDFIFQDGARDGIAMLALVFKNDSVASHVAHLSSSTSYNLTLEDTNRLGVKQVKGFFMLNKSNFNDASSSTLHLMALSNIHLLRCRMPKNKPEKLKEGDRIPHDSLRKDPQRMRVSKQQELQNTRGENIPVE